MILRNNENGTSRSSPFRYKYSILRGLQSNMTPANIQQASHLPGTIMRGRKSQRRNSLFSQNVLSDETLPTEEEKCRLFFFFFSHARKNNKLFVFFCSENKIKKKYRKQRGTNLEDGGDLKARKINKTKKSFSAHCFLYFLIIQHIF